MTQQQNTPLISVIVTMYNRADVVCRAINSVFAQTLTDYELIVVDDASTDNSVETVKALNDERIRIVVNEVNKGIAGAKNSGIKAAKGQFIAFLDSDDEWEPEKLAKQYLALKNAGDDKAVSFCGVKLIRENSTRELVRVPYKPGPTWLHAILHGEFFNFGSTLFAKKEAFEKIGLLDETITRMEDRDWMLRHFDHYADFVVVTEPLAKIINSGWPKATVVAESLAIIRGLHAQRLEKMGCLNLFDASLMFEQAVADVREGDKLKALAALPKILLKYPLFARYLLVRFMRKFTQADFK